MEILFSQPIHVPSEYVLDSGRPKIGSPRNVIESQICNSCGYVNSIPPVVTVTFGSDAGRGDVRVYNDPKLTYSPDAKINGEYLILPVPKKSFLKVDFEIKKKLNSPYILTLEDKGSLSQIIINGYRVERGDVSRYLVEGKNTIEITPIELNKLPYSIHFIGVSVRFNPFDIE